MKFLIVFSFGLFLTSCSAQSNFVSLQSRVSTLARNAEAEIERIHQDASGYLIRSVNEVLQQAYDDSNVETGDDVMVSACNLNVVNLLRGDMREVDDAIMSLNLKIVEFKTIIFHAVEDKSLLTNLGGVYGELNEAITVANGNLQEEIFATIRRIATFKADTYNLIKTHRKCIAIANAK
ncbi:hypothetical protein DMENIID0001_135290 [Sergentomyia squamirostris]